MKYLITAVTGLIAFILAGLYIDSLAHDAIAQTVKFTVYGLGFAVVVLVGVGALAGLVVAFERLRMLRAERRQAEQKADVFYIVAEERQQVYVRDTNCHASWRPAHLDARTYANGRQTSPTAAELAAWQAYNSPRIIPALQPAGLALPAVHQIDLLAALDAVQRCLIVGASDTGKTTLLQWLVSRKLATSRVIVIDPHSYPGKYPAGSVIVGQGRNYAEIDQALAALVKLMSKRYDEIGRGLVAEMSHGRITILIDEWRAIVYNVKGASEAIKALLTESRKAAFSVFVATHSDRARPLGLEGEYDLKDGFAVVRLTNVNGQRLATLDTGNGEIPAILPGPYAGPAQQIVSGDDLRTELEEIKDRLDGDDQEHTSDVANEDNSFVELVRAGKSRNWASLTAYGRPYAGNLVSRGKKALGEL